MEGDQADVEGARFQPRAARPMAEMFDEVSGRYDLINRVLSLGQDAAWRQAMWREVPESARAVLDLCTGSGVSLPGLRRPGRLVIGADVSLGMLELAADEQRTTGWGPRLLCADAFQLPIRDARVDAITIAFGMRNLRPTEQALREMARVMAPGGTLVVLDAAAPADGFFAPFHRFYLARIVPAVGRLSQDPSAYRYLSRSVLAFEGREFEAALASGGFTLQRHRSFLMGATRLWVANRAGGTGQFAVVSPNALQSARASRRPDGSMPSRSAGEWRAWAMVQLVLSASLLASLLYAAWVMVKSGARRGS
jgi:demethylmenaquinone methyltransferase/2-methoxy-6-polyprenyl-1,4-benzoquinol methylase